ncbi:delta-aminolevulinic acid dehydratase [Maribacter sp. LLG6340-A2]|uniref:delta-aminolevulinic acid dehydratase n=1 Tax=Maribacter sp. LLG6340-A2 TaxID=3160834 RepID=UPI00386DF3C1
MTEIIHSFLNLKQYCESEQYKGWDPYDGLNSKIFNALPLKKWNVARLVWIQGFKRSPINFRKLLLVPKQYNSKGLALFLSGYCNLYHVAKQGDTTFGDEKAIKQAIVSLANLLLQRSDKNQSGACWGYNFDWQARLIFLFPKETPTIVATSFCVDALLKAYEITNDNRYLDCAKSAANFVINDLNRTPIEKGFLFSYSPLKGNDTVINASLLGAKILSQVYAYTKEDQLKELARTTIDACCALQSKDGSWVYGLMEVQSWIDSFHTGYNLDAIQTYQDITGDESFSHHLELGLEYYLQAFFMPDGTPKYYHNATYPIDIHCPGQLFVTLAKTKTFSQNKDLAQKVMQWTIEHMQDDKGYFYYQLKKGVSSKISYMRWSNAFMFNAMSNYLKEVS